MNKKYELTNESIEYLNRTLYRIRALRDFGDVKTGDLGGFVESERNLSHYGDCWIFNNAKAIDFSFVGENANLRHESMVKGFARILWNSEIHDKSAVGDSAEIRDSAIILDRAYVGGNTIVGGGAMVGGGACLLGDAYLRGRAFVTSNKDFITITGVGFERGTINAYCCSNGEVEVNLQGFRGGIDEFINEMGRTQGYSDYIEQYLAAVNLIRLTIKPERHAD